MSAALSGNRDKAVHLPAVFTSVIILPGSSYKRYAPPKAYTTIPQPFPKKQSPAEIPASAVISPVLRLSVVFPLLKDLISLARF
jgi:hypothetical protein